MFRKRAYFCEYSIFVVLTLCPVISYDVIFQKCVAMCMDRYMDSWNLVSRTYTSRIQRERNNM